MLPRLKPWLCHLAAELPALLAAAEFPAHQILSIPSACGHPTWDGVPTGGPTPPSTVSSPPPLTPQPSNPPTHRLAGHVSALVVRRLLALTLTLLVACRGSWTERAGVLDVPCVRVTDSRGTDHIVRHVAMHSHAGSWSQAHQARLSQKAPPPLRSPLHTSSSHTLSHLPGGPHGHSCERRCIQSLHGERCGGMLGGGQALVGPTLWAGLAEL